MPAEIESKPNHNNYSHLLFIFGVVLASFLIFSIGPYLKLVEQLGYRIPQGDMVTDYVTALVWAGFLGGCIFFSPIRHKDKHVLLWAWMIKCFMALFVLLFYEAHYPSDAEGYWGAAQNPEGVREILNIDIFSGFFNAGLHTYKMNTLVWYYLQIVPDVIAESYHSLKVTFAMIGLIAMYVFYRASIIITNKENRAFFWVLILFPSLLIWTSRVGKESLMCLGVALFTLGLVGWHYKRKNFFLVLGLIGLVSCTFLRIWVGATIMASLFFYFWIGSKKTFNRLTSTLLIGILLLMTYNLILKKFYIANGVQGIYKKLERVASYNRTGGSTIYQETIVINGATDIVKYAPKGMFTALFRPLPGDVPGPLGALAGMEGFIILFCFFRAAKRTRLRELSHPILVWAVSFILFWALIYGFAMQNFGTAVRWKTQILPIFLGLLFYLGRLRLKEIKLPKS